MFQQATLFEQKKQLVKKIFDELWNDEELKECTFTPLLNKKKNKYKHFIVKLKSHQLMTILISIIKK